VKTAPGKLCEVVQREVDRAPVLDMHTHLFEPEAGGLLLWGIDELLTYHYLIAELARARPDIPPAAIWKMTKRAQADLVWRELFLERSPLSEACRGVLTCLQELGVRIDSRAPAAARARFSRLTPRAYVDLVFGLAGVQSVVMTNNPFDAAERRVWMTGGHRDPRFLAALRIDALLRDWPAAARQLRSMGYAASSRRSGPDSRDSRAVLKFLSDWADRMDPVYLAASLPPEFDYPDSKAATAVLQRCLLPFGAQRRLPLALMIGARIGVNPELSLAGDGVGRSKVEAVEALCREWPEVRFLITFLSRENQHQACIASRKFPNLMPFGCWWFLNNPSIIRMMTAQRIELLGTGMIPQHSDARVLDQLIYKWRHSRRLVGEVLVEKYADLAATGWRPSASDIRRDVERLFSRNFLEFAGR
jgi:hypothetical protein